MKTWKNIKKQTKLSRKRQEMRKKGRSTRNGRLLRIIFIETQPKPIRLLTSLLKTRIETQQLSLKAVMGRY